MYFKVMMMTYLFQSKAAYVLVYQKQNQLQPQSKPSATVGSMNGQCNEDMETY